MKRNFSARLLALTVALLLAVFSFGGALAAEQGGMLSGTDEAKAQMEALYGENQTITDGNYDAALAVKCVNGTFVGKKTDENVIAYKGIPYVGAQPVGEYRWKAPVDVAPDEGVYEAYYFGKVPCQVANVGQRGSLYPQGEDCLHLNIWKADDTGDQKKPVMVWIHGGAYEVGGTPEPREEGTNFVHENPDVILVSVEYRLNALGFLHLSHLPDGADYPDAQNLGLMDQMMALKWIHENIAGFGGDPSLSADISPDGTEKVWPLYDLENKQVMIFDEDNIHAEKESERQIIDWDRTYFLTKYYSI